jgi:hypothetical protein
MDELKDAIFILSTETNRYSCLFGSEGKENGFAELNVVLQITDKASLANAILELALLEVKIHCESFADLENWLDDIQIKDNRLYWKFPIYT